MIVEGNENSKDVRVRNPSNYEDLSGRFRLLIRSYDKQFASIYTVRIIEARRKLEKIVPKKWGNYSYIFSSFVLYLLAMMLH